MKNEERKYSLAYLTVGGCSPEEMTYIASRAGYDYVSYRLISMNLPGEPNFDLTKDKQLFNNTKQALNNTGLELLDIELARIDDEHDPKSYEPAMEVAAELGGRHVLSSIWTDNHDLYIERFAQVCDLAKQYGLTVDLEYVPIASVTNLEGAKNVLNTVKRDNAGLLIDIHHFHRAGDNPEELAKLPKEWFNFIHLCNAVKDIPQKKEDMIRILREERSYLGEDGIDVKSIVDAMPNIPFSIESPNLANVKKYGVEEHARRSLEAAKNYFSKRASSKEKSVKM